MLIVDSAVLMPGGCFITGRNDGPFIDTGYDIDDRPNVGRVYIAESAVSDMAGMFGFLNPTDAARLRDAVEARDARIAELEQAVAGLTAANEALVAAGYNPLALEPIGDLGIGGGASEGDAPDPVSDPVPELTDDDLRELVAEVGLPGNASRADMLAALASLTEPAG